MRYLSGSDLRTLLQPAALIAAMETALRDFARSEVTIPTRQHMSFTEGTLLLMPAVGPSVFGTKLVSVVPGNAQRDLPVVNGLMILNDRATGRPLAIFDAAELTAQRTGAVGAIGIKYTTPESVDRIGIIGCGAQGIAQATYICATRNIQTICYVARSDATAQRFTEAVTRNVPHVRFVRCKDAKDLLAQCSVVITATTSSEPVLPDDAELLRGKHFLSVGSFKPSMQELPSSVCKLAGCAVVDSDAASREAGDLCRPVSAGLLREEDVIHLADLVTGKRTVDVGQTTVVKSVGMALYDLYAAGAFLEAATRQGRGTPLQA